MHVVEFRYDFYRPRTGFSQRRGVLKHMEPEKQERERICADLFRVVRPSMAPDVRIDDETKNLLIRFIDGECFRATRGRGVYTKAQRFDLGFICAVDLMINTDDRHGGNMMVLPRHIIPIDHEHTLGGPPRARGVMAWAAGGLNYRQRHRMYASAAFRRGFETALCRIDKHAKHIARLLNRNGHWRINATGIRSWVAQERKVAYKRTI